ncbi:amidohydrolase [Paraburkholderia sp. BR13439]|uniref:amidohydrolase n=1 Tax=Paraburkholderia sp. BR13439 TaxID=3236996 RepID=UPI0034CD47F7
MAVAEEIWNLVDVKKEDFFVLSDKVWATPELSYNEFRSVTEHVAMLEQEGFRIVRNVAGIPTAVMGEAGEGGPIIAFLGEYDALPGLSQAAGLAEFSPVEKDGHGHGCGHNLLGAAALLAATAVKDYLAANGLKGRVRYYGCPAEEGGAGKAFMARAGAFDDVDAAITWHPAFFNMVWDSGSLATLGIDFSFTGRTAHAAATPHLGRSALDAVELMNVGVNYMREHMSRHARIHYAIIDAGGIAPNVVQSHATVRYSIRAAQQTELVELAERVRKVAKGAALMTETEVSEDVHAAVASLLRNRPLEEALHANLVKLGPTGFDERDRAIAAPFQTSCSAKAIAASYELWQLAPREHTVLCDEVWPLRDVTEPVMGSTDVGDVSRTVPTVQLLAATHVIGPPSHTWQWTAQSNSDPARKGLAYAAKIMAATGADVLTDDRLRTAIKDEFRRQSALDPFTCLMPAALPPACRNKPPENEPVAVPDGLASDSGAGGGRALCWPPTACRV